MTSTLVLLLWLSSTVALASAQQSVSHFGGGYGGYNGGRGPALSKYNPATKNYEPVTSDKQYIYYRLSVNLDQTFTDNFTPDGQMRVGTYDSYAITSAVKATGELQFLLTVAAEFGPEGDDTIHIQAAFDRANLIEEISDFDLAVLGGTGRYKGATGEAQHFGTDATSRENNLYVLEVAVPKFKRF